MKEDTIRAKALYDSEGFVTEGVLRECPRAGDAYETLVLMSLLRREYDQAASR